MPVMMTTAAGRPSGQAEDSDAGLPGPALPWCQAEPPSVILAACPAHRLGTSELWAAGMEQPDHLQEEVLHDVVVVRGAAVWEEAGSKDDNGIETFSVVP